MTITSRIDNITKIPAHRRSDLLAPPESVKIELTARCDFNCFFCASGQRLRKKRDMDQELYERIVIELAAIGVKELGVFYLGESFLVSWLPQAIQFAKDAGIGYVFLTTNGRLATAERVKQCLDAGLDSLKFSFNNADPEQFNEVTGVKRQVWGQIISNIRNAWHVREGYTIEQIERIEMGEIDFQKPEHERYRCGIYASSIMYDGSQQEKMEEAVCMIKPFVDEHYYLPLYNQAAYTTEQEEQRGYVPTAGNQGRIGALRAPVPCWSAFTEGHITYDGKLSACCFDHDGRFEMGDLTRDSFVDAWNSLKFRRLRLAHMERDLKGTPCEECVAYK